VKKSANPGWNIGFLEKRLVTTEDVGIAGGVAEYDVVKGIADNGKTINYTGNSDYYTVGVVMLLNGGGFVNGMVASHLLCHSGTINRHSLNG
ncbi:hypothetical protein RZP13_29505, partial [Klebsiella quasipneumoniae subsp. similipneumoniae]|nr:hypothetical protein [Klebsiella quasipneumoniae subsp. similipneumoniae]